MGVLDELPEHIGLELLDYQRLVMEVRRRLEENLEMIRESCYDVFASHIIASEYRTHSLITVFLMMFSQL